MELNSLSFSQLNGTSSQVRTQKISLQELIRLNDELKTRICSNEVIYANGTSSFQLFA